MEESVITFQTDVFDVLNLSFASFSCIQQLADHSHQHKDDDYGMKLEDEEKQ